MFFIPQYLVPEKRSEIYKSRLDQLGWNRSQLVRAIAQIRNDRGDKCSFRQIQTSIYRALRQPEKSAAGINDDIVLALGGLQIIQWPQRVEIQINPQNPGG